MKKLKIVKKELKNKKVWRSYVKKYKHRQMKMIASKVALIYKNDLPIEKLVQLELKMLQANKDDEQEMFVKIFKNFGDLIDVEGDWVSFANFLFYIYQISTYYYDQVWKKKNIYSKTKIIENNYKKRTYFYAWLGSLDVKDKDFNNKIIKVQKEVF